MARLNIRCDQCGGKGKVVVQFLSDARGNPTLPVLGECDICMGTGLNFAPFLMGDDGQVDLLPAATSRLSDVEQKVLERSRQPGGYTKFYLVSRHSDWHRISFNNTPEHEQLRPISPEDKAGFLLPNVDLKLISDMPEGHAVLISRMKKTEEETSGTG